MRRTLFLFFAFSLLFVSFHWNIFGIERSVVANNIVVVDCYITPTLDLYAGDASLRGRIGEIQLQDYDGRYRPYVMSVGLHRILYSALSPSTRAGVDRAIPHLRALIEALLALTLTLFVLVVCREFGYACAGITTVMLALSDWLIIFAPDLFWICFTFFLPFVLVWLWGDPHRPVWQQRIVAALFALACLFKCLCGYDYTTNIIGAAAVPLLYYGLKRGASLRDIALRVARYAVLGVGAFSTAILLQLAQFKFVEQNPTNSLDAFLKEVHRRTLSNGEGVSANYDAAVLSFLHHLHVSAVHDGMLEHYLAPMRPVLRYFRYLSMGAITLPMGTHSVSLPIGLFIAGLLLAAAIRYKHLRRALIHRSGGPIPLWTLATLAALVISHLWVVAANGHMTHTFFNAIVFYIPFLPMVYVLAAAGALSWWNSSPTPAVG